jgi:hypothetical protein
MPNIEAVVAVAGWEERFVKGLRLDMESSSPVQLIVFAFEEYLSQTDDARAEVMELAKAKGIRHRELLVKREPIGLWRSVRDAFADREWAQRSVLVDITTMPREVIWWTFSSLRSVESEVGYVYHRPESYPSTWVTRDTDQPRLVYQHSGVSEFGRYTCLLLVSGFDTDRAAQLIQFFEPRSVIIGLQVGSQYENQAKNVSLARGLLDRTPNVRFFDMDAYSSDHGLAAMEAAIVGQLGHYNIVAASLGPKPSAVALYRLHCKHPEIALTYAPSRQFNMKYSEGIGEAVRGELAV